MGEATTKLHTGDLSDGAAEKHVCSRVDPVPTRTRGSVAIPDHRMCLLNERSPFGRHRAAICQEQLMTSNDGSGFHSHHYHSFLQQTYTDKQTLRLPLCELRRWARENRKELLALIFLQLRLPAGLKVYQVRLLLPSEVSQAQIYPVDLHPNCRLCIVDKAVRVPPHRFDLFSLCSFQCFFLPFCLRTPLFALCGI